MLLYALIVIIVLLMCQIIGYWINNNIPQNTSIEINDFLRFTHIRNFGGIFGLAQNMGWLFALISVLLLVGVSIYLWIHPSTQKYEYICDVISVTGPKQLAIHFPCNTLPMLYSTQISITKRHLLCFPI